MSNNNLHVHDVTRVSIETEEVRLDSGDGYSVYRVDIFSVNHRDEEQEFRVTLYGKIGEKGGAKVPFEFSKDEDDEPPPALKLEMERDLKGAVAMGKVWGEVFDSLFAPKR